MNKIYRLVWNTTLKAWVAVSELATSHGKSASGRAIRASGAAGALLAAILSGPAEAFIAAGSNELSGTTDGGVISNTAINGGAATNPAGNSIAAGANAQATSDSSVALGSNVTAGTAVYDPLLTGMIAIGSKAFATNKGAIAIGTGGTSATGASSIALGTGVNATADNAVALGTTAQATNGSTVAIGNDARATGQYGVAIGYMTRAQADAGTAGDGGTGTTAVGDRANASGTAAAAYGYETGAVGQGTTAMGSYSAATKQYASALGYMAKATGGGATAVGNNANAAADYSTAIGRSSAVTGDSSTAIGRSSSAAGVNAIAVGSGAKTTVDRSLAAGFLANASLKDGVALGSYSVTSVDKGVAGYLPSGISQAIRDAILATQGTLAAVSVGGYDATNSVQNYRQITNLAAGTTDSDAVNVAQLKGAVSSATSHYYSVNDNGVQGANYDNDGATGINALAAGIGAASSGRSSVTLGEAAKATNTDTIAVGHNATASSANSAHSDMIAVGLNANASSDHAVAIGTAAAAKNSNSLAVGSNATASGDASSAFGHNATASGSSSTALGLNATASKGSSVAIGYQSNSSADNSAAIGYQAASQATNSLAFGNGAKALTGATSAIAIGNAASASAGAINSIALGNGATSAATGAMALGSLSQARANNALAAGISASATGVQSSALGYMASATKLDAIAQGSNAKADGQRSIAVGGLSNASGDVSTAIGFKALASDFGATALGGEATASGTNATSLGYGATASGNFSLASGNLSAATGVFAQAQGNQAYAEGDFSLALGTFSLSSGNDSIAIGTGAVSKFEGDVALGAGSVTDAAVGTTGVGLGGPYFGRYYDFAGANPASTVSVGSKGSERTITNVAAGRIAPDSTDAINGSELFATNSALDELGYTVSNFAGDTSFSYTYNNGIGIRYARTNEAGLSQSDSSAQGMGSTAVGYEATSLGESSLALGRNARTNNANDVALGAGSATDAAVGTSGVNIAGNAYSFAGAAPSSTVSVGSVGHERTLTNLAAGRISNSSTDAINGSQLFATNSAIDTLNIDIDNLDKGSVKYDVNGDGSINYNSVTLNQGGSSTTITNVAAGDVSATSTDAVNGSQLDATNQSVTKLGDTVTNIAGDTNSYYTDVHGVGIRYARTNEAGLPMSDASAEGQGSTAVGYNATSVGDSSLALGREARANNANDVALGAGSATDAAVGTSGVNIAGNAYSFAGAAPSSTVSVGSVGHERTITNLAAGRISNSSTDAINGSQLFATNSAIDTLNIDIDNLDKGSVKYDVNGDGSINYNSVTLNQGGSSTTITNVAAGDVSATSTDAVNGSQLNDTNVNVTNLGNTVTTIGDTITNIAGDTTTYNIDGHGTGIRYARTNEAGLVKSDASAEGQGSTAVGYNATSLGDSSLALGREASATHANDVALGAGSVTAAAAGTAGVTIRGDYYGFAGTAPVSTVSVGSVGHERTITNLAAGRIAASSTDAINGSQLFATNKAIDNLNLNVDVVDKSAVKYVTNTDGSINYNSVVMAGDTYNSVTKTGGTRINNVAYGIDPSDAVNVQQLNEATTNIYTNGVKYFHANSSKADSIASGSDSIAVGPAAVASGTSAIAVGDGALAQGNGSTAVGQGAVASANGSVAIGKGASDNGRGAQTYTGKYSGAQNVTVGTVSVGNAATGETRTISNVADAKQATDAVNLRQLDGAVAQSNQYTDNSISKVNNSIVNVDKRITSVDNRVTKVEGDVSNIKNGTDGMFQTNNTSKLPKPTPTGRDAIAGGAGAVASGANSVAIGTSAKATASNAVALGNNSVADRANSVSVGNAGAERQITHVAAGSAATDAVNVAQLNKSMGDTTNIANAYTDSRYSELKNDLNEQDDILSAGIAGAMAMASLPQPYAPGASMAAAGAGTYRGQGAVAIGVSRISDNGKWVTKMQGSTTTQGDLGVSVGVGYQW